MTFRKDLGIEPGDKIELSLLPESRAALKPARAAGTIVGFLALLAAKSGKKATLAEIDDTI